MHKYQAVTRISHVMTGCTLPGKDSRMLSKKIKWHNEYFCCLCWFCSVGVSNGFVGWWWIPGISYCRRYWELADRLTKQQYSEYLRPASWTSWVSITTRNCTVTFCSWYHIKTNSGRNISFSKHSKPADPEADVLPYPKPHVRKKSKNPRKLDNKFLVLSEWVVS